MSALPASSVSPGLNHQELQLVEVPHAAATGALSVLAVAPPGGTGASATHLAELGHGLTRQGDRFRAVAQSTADTQPPAAVARRARLPITVTAFAILRALLDEPTDIVQCTSIRTTYAAALAILAAGLRHPRRHEPALITTLPFLPRSPFGAAPGDLCRRAARHLRLLSDGVIVSSASVRAALLAHGFPEDRVAAVPAIHNLRACLRVAEHTATPPTIPGVPPKARVILTISRPGPHSGLTYLIEAWPLIARAIPNAYLVVATTGATTGATTKAMTGSDLPGGSNLADDVHDTLSSASERIVVTGTRIPIPALLARADVVALSTLHEGTPITLLRALAAGRPVVATTSGGTAELITHEQTGLLVPPCDCPALAVAVQTLLGNRALAHRLADAGQRFVRQHYTRHTLVAATRAFYLHALDQRASRAAALMPYEM